MLFQAPPADHPPDLFHTLGGETVRELNETSGLAEITWDGRDENLVPAVPGIFIYTYESPGEKGIGRFTLK